MDTALIEAAQRIMPLVRACRDEGERERRLPAQVLAAMHEARLFRMYIPKALDGLEIDPITSMIVIEEIARADAAAAWNLMLGAIYGRGAATPMSATIPTRRRAELAPPLAWSTWANDKTNWPSRCADAHLMLTSFDPRKAGPTDLRRRHRTDSLPFVASS